ncbi:MAG: cysteine synthase [Candidatus Dormiibacterota bacterium]
MPSSDPQLSIVPARLGSSLLDLIGRTPLLRIRLFEEEFPEVRVFAKAEYRNPGGSVKDRPALRMITEAERRGLLTRDRVILDATSGNTGVAYAMIGAAKGYRVHLVMPRNVSTERRALVHAYGAEVTFSDPMEGSDGAIRLCREVLAADPDHYYMPDQYNNPENWRAHYHGTANEIWEQTRGAVTHFVAALGTGGTFVGTGRRLRELNPEIRLYSVQPESPWHGLEGLKHMQSAIVPGIYDPNLADRDLGAPTEDAYELARRLATTEGILAGHSSGANLWGVREVAREIESGVIVTILCDGGDRYLSTGLYGLTPP